MRDAINTMMTVDIAVKTTPTIGCQIGMDCPVAIRNNIVVGVAGGNSEKPVAILPNGSWTIKIQMNMGLINSIQTGNSMDWASFSCDTEAPIAMKMAA